MISLLLLTTLQTPAITIPCATYSLPEIAQKLSTNDLTVEVAPSLTERGLLIGLHDRSQDEALNILCKGLDLVAVKKGTGTVRLEPDPVVAKRESRWQTALLQNMTRRWSIQHERFKRLVQLDPDKLQDVRRELKPDGDPFSGDVSMELMMLGANRTLTTAAAEYVDSLSPDFRETLLTDGIQRDEAKATLDPETIQKVQKAMALVGPLRDPVMLQRIFTRSLGDLAVSSDVFATSRDGKWVVLPNGDSKLLIRGMDRQTYKRNLFEVLAHPFAGLKILGLGEDAKSWLKDSQDSTLAAEKDPSLDEEQNIPATDASLSGLVGLWATAHNQDVVMELDPIPESLLFGPTSGGDFRMSITHFLSLDQDWGLDSVNGALEVRNRMAFLDHIFDHPLGDIAVYIRNNPNRSGTSRVQLDKIDSLPDLPNIDQLLPLVKRRYGSFRLRFNWFSPPAYHGLTDQTISQGGLLLWPGIPSEAKEQMNEDARGKVRIPLRQCSDESIQDLISAMGSPEMSEARSKEILRVLQNVSVSMAWKRRTNGETAVSFTLLGFPEELSYWGNPAMFQVKL